MERWTRAMIRYRWWVVGIWAVLFLLGGYATSGLSDLLTNRFTLPGTDTARADSILEDHFGQKTVGSFSVVVKGAPGSAEQLLPIVRERAAAAAKELPTGQLAGVQAVSDSVVSATIVSNLEPADAKGHTDDMRAAAGEIPGVTVYVSGQAAIEHDLDPVFAHDLQVGELFIAIPIAALILAFVFGTLAFLLPLIFAAAAIPTTLAIIWLFAHVMELTTYLQNLVMLIGFGIAIDYSLLIVYRYREELRSGKSKEDAIVRTMETAGRAVVFSGSAVGIGLALMLFMPLPFMRGFGIGGLVIPLVSVACALTLLPVLVYFCVNGLDRVRIVPKRVLESRDSEYNFWWRLSRGVMRHARAVAAVTTAFLLLLALPVLWLEVGPGSNKGIPQTLEGVEGLNVISDAVGEGALAPTAIVGDTGRAGGVDSTAVRAAIGELEQGLRADPEVAAVRFGEGPQYVDPSGRYFHIDVIGTSEYGTAAGPPLRRPLAGRHRPVGGLSGRRERLRGRRPAERRRLPRPHVRSLPVARRRRAAADATAWPRRRPPLADGDVLRRRYRDRAHPVQAAGESAGADQRRRLHRPVCDHQLLAGLIWDFTIKQYPTPFGSAPFLGSQLISTHQAGMIGVTVLLLLGLYFFFQYTRIGLAMRAAASVPIGPPRRHQHVLDDRARLGHGDRDRRNRRHADRPCRVPRAQHDGRRADLRLCRRGARRSHQPVRRRGRRLPGRDLREPRRHLHPRRRQ